jgi:hypothetical protein
MSGVMSFADLRARIPLLANHPDLPLGAQSVMGS